MPRMLQESSWPNSSRDFPRAEKLSSRVVGSYEKISSISSTTIPKCVWIPLKNPTKN